MIMQIQTKVSDWHAKFALNALETWCEILADPRMKEVLTDVDAVATYAQYSLGDGKSEAPFYWKEWNGGVKKVVSTTNPI